MGLLAQSYVYLNLKTKRERRKRIPADGLGQQVLWLNSAPDGTIYGGPALGQTFFSFQPKSNLLTSYSQVVDCTGEVYYGIPYQQKFYMISYPEAILSVLRSLQTVVLREALLLQIREPYYTLQKNKTGQSEAYIPVLKGRCISELNQITDYWAELCRYFIC